MNTTSSQTVGAGRRRRKHSAEFKANAVASCQQPGMSMAAVAMANGVNANLLRRWVHEAQAGREIERPTALVANKPAVQAGAVAFVPMPLPQPNAAPDIRIELRRGATSVTVTWPSDAATQCAAWMRELLR